MTKNGTDIIPNRLARAFTGALAAFALAGALLVGAAPAHAAYNDVAAVYPATQNLEVGAYVDVADIPDGDYSIPAKTTSTMCIMYDTVTGAANSAHLSVSGGTATVTFAISGAYNAIFFGTAEEAAAATNEDGTDGSAYIFGDPPDGYEIHRMSIGIHALNDPITIATYSGGKPDRPMWYTREFVFYSSPEIEAAIEAGAKPEPEPEQTPSEQDPTPSEQQPTPSEQQPTPSESTPTPSETTPSEATTTPSESTPAAAATTTTTPSSTSSTSTRTTTTTRSATSTASTASTASEATSANAASAVTAAPKLHGTGFTIAEPEQKKASATAVAPEQERKFRLTAQMVIGAGAVVLILGGILYRALKFRHDFDGPRK